MAPVRTLSWLAGIFLATFLLNLFLWSNKFPTGTTWLFPLSQFIGPEFHKGGMIWALLFLGVFLFAFHMPKPHWLTVWGCGVALLILGNLMQGDWETAFHFPFTAFGLQYYQDALPITDAAAWLSGFNETQPSLTIHAKTHPPFAVLIHWVFLEMWDSLDVLALGFTLLSSLALPCLWAILKTLGHDSKASAKWVILFAVIPAWNIYACVSLDGLVVMAATLAYLGLTRFVHERPSQGLFWFAVGTAVMNLLTFAGTFLLLLGWIVVIHHDFLKKSYRGLLGMSCITVVGLVFVVVMKEWTGYDHIQAFFTASRLENPHGFLAFAKPLQYVMTRLAGFWEIALFASPLLFAFFWRDAPRWRQAKSNAANALVFWGMVSLLLMFLVGAFRVGETGRACLFIYPLILLAVCHLDAKAQQWMAWVAALATVVMQLIGNYIW